MLMLVFCFCLLLQIWISPRVGKAHPGPPLDPPLIVTLELHDSCANTKMLGLSLLAKHSLADAGGS